MAPCCGDQVEFGRVLMDGTDQLSPNDSALCIRCSIGFVRSRDTAGPSARYVASLVP